MLAREVTFLIVGTPRSGTSMLRRLACEIPGVRVPNETHFFRGLTAGPQARGWKLEPRAFPLVDDRLRAAISSYAALEVPSRIFEIEPERIVEDLDGRCDSPLELFDAIVRHLAGPAVVYGEKTPDHIFWWRSLTTARPAMKLVFMVRDPRAVAASQADESWGLEAQLVAERWAFDARQIATAQQELGPERGLLLRYEDVVVHPDAARERLRAFLGVDTSAVTEERLTRFPSELFPRGERTTEPITTATVEAWRERLAPERAAFIAARCRKEMEQLGFTDDRPSRPRAMLEIGRAGPRALLALRRARHNYRRRVQFAERFSRNGVPGSNSTSPHTTDPWSDAGFSLANLADLLFACLDARGPRSVAEIGAHDGHLTRELLSWAGSDDVRITAVDPMPSADLVALKKRHPQLELVAETSRDALSHIEIPEAVIIDGDHNYYTVSEELRMVAERAGDELPLLLFHDIGWPHGRRDSYFAPEQIPEEHRQPLGHRVTIAPGDPGLAESGLRYAYAARREGGPRNGVLTAIEDFVADRPGLRLATVPAFFGLGVVWDRDAPWAGAIGEIVEPWQGSSLVERLEANRVANIVQRQRQAQLLRRLLRSRAFAWAERASRLGNRGQPIVSREQIRQVLGADD